MSSSRRSRNKQKIDISDLYAVRFGALWQQFKLEHLSFRLLCAYFLFEYVRPQSIYPVLDVLPWAQLLLMLSVICAFLDKSVVWTGNIENKYINVFSVILVVSSLLAFNPAASWKMIDIFINWVLVYYLLINIVNTERRMLIFTLLYLLFSFKMAQHGAVSWASRGFSFANWGLIGAGGWFQNSGEFAIQMLIFIGLSTGLIVGLRRYWGRYMRYFFYLMPLTGVLSVIGASSRGSQLGLAIIGLWLLVKSKQKFKAVVVMAMLGLLLISIVPQEQMQRFQDAGDDETSLQRLAYWKKGMEIIGDHPVIGIGFYNWIDYLNYVVPDGIGIKGVNQLPHNIYIQVASELGLLGLLVFVLMILSAFWMNSRTRKMAIKVDKPVWVYVAFGLDAGLIGYLVAGFFVTVFYYPFFWIQIAMIVALYNVVDKQLKVKENKASRMSAVKSKGVKKNIRNTRGS